MPERDLSRSRYDNENYRAYLRAVTTALPEATFVDLHKFLNDSEFHDLEHSNYGGSQRLTREIIDQVNTIF